MPIRNHHIFDNEIVAFLKQVVNCSFHDVELIAVRIVDKDQRKVSAPYARTLN
jgi:hypothetical protein